MKALSLLVQKLLQRLSFFKSRSKVKVKVRKSKILELTDRSCIKKIHAKYESLISFGSKVTAKVKFFSKVGQKSRSRSQIILISSKRSCHKEYTCVILKLYLLLLKSYGQDRRTVTDRRTDRRTDRQTDRQGDSYISPNFDCGGTMTLVNDPWFLLFFKNSSGDFYSNLDKENR